MELVTELLFHPSYCAASLRAEDPRGFIDFQVNLPEVDPHIYLSVTSVEEAGRMIGMLPAANAAEKDVRIAELEAVVDEQATVIAEREAVIEAYGVLKAAGRVAPARAAAAKTKQAA